MTNKYFGGTVNAPTAVTDELDKELYQAAADTFKEYTALMEEYRNADAAEVVMTFAKRCNKYIDETAPWVLAKNEEDKPRLETVLYNLLESIRALGVMLTPFIPSACASIAAQLQIGEEAMTLDSLNTRTASFSVGEASPLFQRIDAVKMLAEIEAEQAAAVAAAEAAEKAAETQQGGRTMKYEYRFFSGLSKKLRISGNPAWITVK